MKKNIFKALSIVAFGSYFCLVSITSHAQKATSEELRGDIEYISENLEQAKQQKKYLHSWEGWLESAINDVKNIKDNFASRSNLTDKQASLKLDSILSELDRSIRHFSSMPDQFIDENDKNLLSIESRLEEFDELFETPSYSGLIPRVSSKGDRDLYAYVSNLRNQLKIIDKEYNLPSTERLKDVISSVTWDGEKITASVLSKWLQITRDDLSKLSGENILAIRTKNIENYKSAAEVVYKSFVNEQSKVLSEIEAVEPTIEQLKSELAEEKKYELIDANTSRLVVYMMWLLLAIFVVAILYKIILIFSSKTFDDNHFSDVDKSVIEFGGMAFLLLSIIIMALGGFMENQAIGSLLGTIAGYIFGKNVSDKKKDK